MRISKQALDIAKNVVDNIEGRAADHGISLPFLAAMVEAAPDGDHIDIGSLFGASAITAALMKKELGHKGKIYCVDPYDEEERAVQVVAGPDLDPNLVSASPEELMANAKKFDVELILIQKKSDPWPKELETVTFATAYIDGAHIGEGPWKDFENLRGRVTNYIGCDNYEEEYPDVVSAMNKAAETDDWFPYYKNITFYSLRRILPSRSDPTAPFQMLSL